nr:MAG TPA: hypothetical protein [Caudoviricetes sp.]
MQIYKNKNYLNQLFKQKVRSTPPPLNPLFRRMQE